MIYRVRSGQEPRKPRPECCSGLEPKLSDVAIRRVSGWGVDCVGDVREGKTENLWPARVRHGLGRHFFVSRSSSYGTNKTKMKSRALHMMAIQEGVRVYWHSQRFGKISTFNVQLEAEPWDTGH